MANQLPMTLQDIQDRIHVLTSSDPTTPSASDDQYKTRLTNINLAISRWERQDVFWRELFATTTLSPVITAGQTSYPIGSAAGFKNVASLITVVLTNGNTLNLDVKDLPDKVLTVSGGQFTYITGNPRDGYSLNLSWIPSATDTYIGGIIQFDYYKSAQRLVNPTDIPEMSNPDYICYWASAQELLFSGMNSLAQNYLAEADDALDNMRITNALMPSYASMQLSDVSVVRDNDYWGE